MRIEKALSEAPSGTLTTTHQVGMTRTIAMLSKLWLITGERTFTLFNLICYHSLYYSKHSRHLQRKLLLKLDSVYNGQRTFKETLIDRSLG